MKASKLALLLSLGLLPALAVLARSPEQTYLESCPNTPAIPQPTAVVSPLVGPGYAGDTVRLEFIVTAAGKPTEVRVQYSPDQTLSDVVVSAVEQWRFRPALRNGAPVATRVVLPVRIVDGEVAGARLASSY